MQTAYAYFENSCVQTLADWLKAIIDTTAAKLILMFFFAFWVSLQIQLQDTIQGATLTQKVHS